MFSKLYSKSLVTRLKEIHLICLVINSIYNSDNLRVIFAKRREEDKNFYLSFRKLRRL